MRLLFVARRAPYPLDNGARIRSHHLLRGLSDAFDTTLLVLEHRIDSPDGWCGREELAAQFPRTRIVTVPGLGSGKRLRQLRHVLSSRSWTLGQYRLDAFEDALHREVRDWLPGIVHYDELAAAQFGPVGNAPSVYASHNVEYRIAELIARRGGLRGLFARTEYPKVRDEEKRVWREMTLSLAVSEDDARIMRDGGARRVEVCPNGTDDVDALPPPTRGASEPLRLLFVGSGAFPPYERGLAWLIREVLPEARRHVELTLDVVGQPPRRPVSADGVVYAGRVPSVRPWYDRAHAAVVPVFEGSGTRLKVIEAMALGRPVVATPLAVEGLPVRPGEHYLEGGDVATFAAALVELASPTGLGSSELAHMLTRARSVAEDFFWPRIVDDLVALYRRGLS